MNTLKDMFNHYKWTVLAGIIVAVLVTLITANLHVLHFMKYKMQNDTNGVLSVLQSQMSNEEVQDDWFFKQGMKYLLEQDEYSEELGSFFADRFADFNLDWKKEIIMAYHSSGNTLPMSQELMNVLIEYIDEDGIKSYVRKLSVDEFEQGLVLVYGNTPAVTEAFVDSIYKVLNAYPEKLSFGKFSFNLYDVLSYSGENQEEKIKFIFGKVDSSVARENIFKELRNKEITEEQLCQWVEFFNSTQLIAGNEYTAFNKIYDQICLLRKQYHELDGQEIQLKNKIEEVEAKISDKDQALEEKQKEVALLEGKVSEVESTLDGLTNYIYGWPLYIEKLAGTGGNEYIAAVPRNSLFGVKPSSQKYIVKLTSTGFMSEGIYNVNVYNKGTKKTSTGEEYAYYVEVSSSDLSNIDTKAAERENLISQLSTLRKEVNQIQNEVNSIKTEYNYDQTLEALNSMDAVRAEYKSNLNEEIIKIRKLFGFSNVKIDLEQI